MVAVPQATALIVVTVRCEATRVKIGKNLTDFFQEMLLRMSLPISKCPLWRTHAGRILWSQ